MKTIRTTRKSATVTWEKPIYDGGNDVTGYVVEYNEAGKDDDKSSDAKWTKCNMPTHYVLTEYTLGDLVENRKYRIRCAMFKIAYVITF